MWENALRPRKLRHDRAAKNHPAPLFMAAMPAQNVTYKMPTPGMTAARTGMTAPGMATTIATAGGMAAATVASPAAVLRESRLRRQCQRHRENNSGRKPQEGRTACFECLGGMHHLVILPT